MKQAVKKLLETIWITITKQKVLVMHISSVSIFNFEHVNADWVTRELY